VVTIFEAVKKSAEWIVKKFDERDTNAMLSRSKNSLAPARNNASADSGEVQGETQSQEQVASCGGSEPPDPDDDEDDETADEKNADEVGDLDYELRTDERKFIDELKKKMNEKAIAENSSSFKSFKRQVIKHKQKLKQYRNKPDSMDDGRLANAKNITERMKIIKDRIDSLKKQIRRHKNQVWAAMEWLIERGIEL